MPTLAEKWARIAATLRLPQEMFTLHETYVRCNHCDTPLRSIRTKDIARHIETARHQYNAGLQENVAVPSQDAEDACTLRTSTFYYDFAEALLAANILPEKLNNRTFCQFLGNYTRKKIPDASTLRKTYLDVIHEVKLTKIREEIGENFIYLIVDETTDHLGRLITHAIVGSLLNNEASVPHLIHCSEVQIANAESIVHFIDDALLVLWPEGIHKDRVLLYISDAVPYMVASARLLKEGEEYEKLVHVTCLAHAFHRVAETVRSTYADVNDIISFTRAVFLKAPRRVDLFHLLAPGVPLPPEPIVTRWGEWLKAASYYNDHFDDILPVIEALVPDARKVCHAQSLWRKPGLRRQFRFIHEKFSVISDAIQNLETRGLALHESLNIVVTASSAIIRDRAIPEIIREKLIKVLVKNKGFSRILMNVFQRLEGDEDAVLSALWTRENVAAMAYAPITSCDVERSFSTLKNIDQKNRSAFLVKNLAKTVLINYNQS